MRSNWPVFSALIRKYVESYLRHPPHIRQDLTLMVRQLQPNEMGIPIEIYTFSAVTKWEEYETIMADIFDHLIAVVPEFGLKVFEFSDRDQELSSK